MQAQTIQTFESRCVNTGTITINGTVGAGGPYQDSIMSAPSQYINTGLHYLANLPDTFAALYPGTYTLQVIDKNGTHFTYPNLVVAGNYILPGNNDYQPIATAVTNCSAPNGSIQGTMTNGRAPYLYTLVSGPAQAGTSNSTGTFSGLIAGTYQVQASDSCQNIQTRSVTILNNNTNYSITGGTIDKIGCDSFSLDGLTVSPALPAGVTYEIVDHYYSRFSDIKTTSLPLHFSASTLDVTNGYIEVILSNGCGVLTRTDQIRTVSNDLPYAIANPVVNRITCDSFNLTSLDVSPSLPPGGYYQVTAYSYVGGTPKIFKSSTLPLNFSTFGNNDIPGGWVQISVMDTCGNVVQQIQPSIVANDWNLLDADITTSCSNGVTINSITTTGMIPGPYTITAAIKWGDGTITPTQTITNFPYTVSGLTSASNTYDIYVTITDACGTVHSVTKSQSFYIGSSTSAFTDCNHSMIAVKAYGSYNGTITYSILPANGIASDTTGIFNNVPDGNYTIMATDACGKTYSIPASLDHSWALAYATDIALCNVGYFTQNISIPIRATGPITYKQYDGGLPLTASSTLLRTIVYSAGGTGLPSGNTADAIGNVSFDSTLANHTYTYIATDSCGHSDTVAVANGGGTGLTPFYHHTWVQSLCINKGNILANWGDNSIYYNDVWIYATDSATGNILLDYYLPGGNSNLSTYPNGQPILNNLPLGTYYIKYGHSSCGNQSYSDTVRILPYVQPSVLTVQSFTPCSGGGTPVIINASGGISPYTYQIIGSTPDNYTDPQQSNPAFTLPTSQSTVTVRLLDACFNSTTKTVAITKATPPIIRPTIVPLTACSLPLAYSLYIDSLYTGSVFAWTKITGTGAGATTLSTSPFLPLVYNSMADTGTYQVVVSVPNTCYAVSSTYDIMGVTLTCAPSISGNVFDDANGLTDSIVNGTGTNAGGINAILVNASNQVVASTAVAPDGTYSFINISAGTYSVLLSTASANTGSVPPSPSLPSNWVSTGENIGTGSGSDGVPNGVLTNIIVSSSSITNADFGIEQIPVANNVSASPQVNPGGTKTVQVPTLNGNDYEDGTYDGTSGINTVIITTLPANATLYYNGIAVSIGQTITDYNPTLLQVAPNSGVITISFNYEEVDAALVSSTPKTVTMPFLSTLPVQFISFNVIAIGTSARLDWQAATETNTSSFVIEHSIDAKTFTKIGELPAQTGSNPESYSLIDMAPVLGVNYYRIKMINADDNYIYSDVKAVTFNDEFGSGVKIYPVPATSVVQLSLPKPATDGMIIQLYDNQDRLVNTINAANRQLIPIRVGSLSSGIYTVKIFKNGTSVYTGRVIKL